MRAPLLVTLLALLGGAGLAAEPAPTLTLETVLAAAEAPHPDLDLARAQQAAAGAEAQLAASLADFRVTLEGALRTGRNAVYNDRFHPDHQARLNARKTLFDAGRMDSGIAAAREETGARDLQLLDTRAQRRLSLMARFFDVLMADMQYAAETEFMATAYVSWDNAKDRQALGQMAQWELAELEARYLDSRTRRNEVLRKLRDKRMQLAGALNRPQTVQEDLIDPKLAGNERPLPELAPLLDALQARNPRLLAQKKLLAATQNRLEGVRADNRPSIEFEAEAAAWSRESSTRDDVRAGLNFVWPLWQGGRVDARMAREQARFQELQAQHDKLQLELRQALADTWEEIQLLRDSERKSSDSNALYRDLALEKARAEYELELKTNLGSSMAETQSARLRKRAVEYRLALALARLEALLGTPLDTVKVEEKK
jgi:outer membrane protein TolC